MGKAIWESKTMWGLLLLVYSIVAKFIGAPELDEDAAADVLQEFASWVMNDLIVTVTAIVGTILNFWGRLTATVKVNGLLKGSKL